MAREIGTLPTGPKDFGLDFNYASWSANSVVTLCNVRWNNDYRDVNYFDGGQAALDDYLDGVSGPKRTISGVKYVRFGQPIKLDIPFNVALEHNYLRVTNPLQPIPGDKAKSYYYFIVGVNYVSANNTEVYVQLDVFQTFMYTTQIGNTYVKRSHAGIANENSMDNHGRDYLTVPEGLDIGGEYLIVDKLKRSIGSAGYHVTESFARYDVMIVSTVSLTNLYGNRDDPNLNSAKGSIMENIASGAEIYFCDASTFVDLMEMLSEYPWISQAFISIQAVPEVDLYDLPVEIVRVFADLESGVFVDLKAPVKFGPGGSSTVKPTSKVTTALKSNWRNSALDVIPAKYRMLKKLLTYPYSVIEMTANTGTPLVLKPESWHDNNATVIEVATYSPSGARVQFYPFRYNAGPSSESTTFPNGVFDDGGEFMDMTTSITNFPQLPMVNNGYLSYMASNKNNIAYQHSSADWSQQKALEGAAVSAQQAGMGIAASQDINAIGNNAAIAGTANQVDATTKRAVVGAVGNVLGGVSGGMAGVASGAGQALRGGIDAVISIDQANAATAIGVGASKATNNRSNALTGQLSDTNRGYAEMAAKGDYANAIGGINARTQDAKMIQNSISGQIGGDSSLLSNYKWGYDLKFKMVTGAALRSLGDYWLRYGYNINAFMRMPSNFKVMTRFTYWETRETYIISSRCPEEFRQTLRGIFEKGVTVWSDPNDIGVIDIEDNQPLTGISY